MQTEEEKAAGAATPTGRPAPTGDFKKWKYAVAGAAVLLVLAAVLGVGYTVYAVKNLSQSGYVLKVAEGMGFDKRIGRHFLNAGIGYGGSCFPKDVDAFIRLSEKNGYHFSLLKEVRNVNEEQKATFIRLIEDKLWILKNKVIGVLGLAFKPDTDDMRNAPAIDIIKTLQHEGAQIKAYDPQAIENAKKFLKDVTYTKDIYSLAKGCDCLLLLTDWNEFKNVNFKKLKQLMRQAIVFDGRNLYQDIDLQELGFEYYGIGRGRVK